MKSAAAKARKLPRNTARTRLIIFFGKSFFWGGTAASTSLMFEKFIDSAMLISPWYSDSVKYRSLFTVRDESSFVYSKVFNGMAIRSSLYFSMYLRKNSRFAMAVVLSI